PGDAKRAGVDDADDFGAVAVTVDHGSAQGVPSEIRRSRLEIYHGDSAPARLSARGKRPSRRHLRPYRIEVRRRRDVDVDLGQLLARRRIVGPARPRWTRV